jgi:hypothetical protein
MPRARTSRIVNDIFFVLQECKDELKKERVLASSFGAVPGSSSPAEITIASNLIAACAAVRDARSAEDDASEELSRASQGMRKIKQAAAEAEIVAVVAAKLKSAADAAQRAYGEGGITMPDVKRHVRAMAGIAASADALAKEMVCAIYPCVFSVFALSLQTCCPFKAIRLSGRYGSL